MQNNSFKKKITQSNIYIYMIKNTQNYKLQYKKQNTEHFSSISFVEEKLTH